MYVVRWQLRSGGETGTMDGVFSKQEAEDIAAEANYYDDKYTYWAEAK